MRSVGKGGEREGSREGLGRFLAGTLVFSEARIRVLRSLWSWRCPGPGSSLLARGPHGLGHWCLPGVGARGPHRPLQEAGAEAPPQSSAEPPAAGDNKQTRGPWIPFSYINSLFFIVFFPITTYPPYVLFHLTRPRFWTLETHGPLPQGRPEPSGAAGPRPSRKSPSLSLLPDQAGQTWVQVLTTQRSPWSPPGRESGVLEMKKRGRPGRDAAEGSVQTGVGTRTGRPMTAVALEDCPEGGKTIPLLPPMTFGVGGRVCHQGRNCPRSGRNAACPVRVCSEKLGFGKIKLRRTATRPEQPAASPSRRLGPGTMARAQLGSLLSPGREDVPKPQLPAPRWGRPDWLWWPRARGVAEQQGPAGSIQFQPPHLT